MSASRRIEKAVFERVVSPIAAEVIDSPAIARSMRRYPIVPYAGTSKRSAHSWLDFFKSIAQQSVVYAACINKKTIYAFGEPVLIDEGGNDVTGASLTSWLSNFSFSSSIGNGITNFAKCVNVQLETTGFCVCIIRISTVASVTKVSFSEVPSGWGLRLRDKESGFNGFIISPSFDDEYLRQNTPDIIPEFPNFKKNEGTLISASMISAGGAVNYGRPPAMSACASAFESILNTNYRSYSSSNAFVPRLILEFEAGDATTGPDSSSSSDIANSSSNSNFAQEFVMRYTNKGDDPPSIMVTERPVGASPVTAIQVNPQTGSDYFEKIQNLNDEQIIAAHGCTRRFLGFESAGGFSKEHFLWDYVVNVEPVIDADRKRFLDWFQSILDELFVMYPALSFLPMRFSFREPIYEAIREIKETRNGQYNS